MWRHMGTDAGWALALATGCWRASAELKLDLAGIQRQRQPLATCDQHQRREDIMRNALEQALEAYAVSRFDKIVYVGDGIWDARGSSQLGFSFVGIEHENHHKKLGGEGASHILPDYRDLDRFLEALHQARVPSK